MYDGAAKMQGKQSGIATRLKEEKTAAVPLHCLAHSLNLCLRDAAGSIIIIHDAMDTGLREKLYLHPSFVSRQAG